MAVMIVDAAEERAKRELRARIGRLRRHIDQHVRGSGHQVRRLTSWRTYVERYPGSAILAALGFGLTLAAGLSKGRTVRWLGRRLMRQGWSTATGLLRQELSGLWSGFSLGRKPAGDTAERNRGANP